jgi:Exostosin family
MEPLKVFLEKSCCNSLREVFNSRYFLLMDNPQDVDVIIFQNHGFEYVRKTELYRKFKNKCFVVTETDNPNFFLPGIYVSNYKNMLSGNRAETYSYFYTDRSSVRNRYLPIYKNKVIEKKYMFAFIGGSTCWVRKRLFKIYEGKNNADFLVCSSNNYNHWDFSKDKDSFKEERQEAYVRNIKEAKFYLCPRGAGYGSIRLFEVMELGVCPVIIADNWVPPEGPNWSDFAIFIKEKDLRKIKDILEARKDEALAMGEKAREVYDDYFAREKHSERIYHMLNNLIANRNNLHESIISAVFPFINLRREFINQSKHEVKKIVLSFPALKAFLKLTK